LLPIVLLAAAAIPVLAQVPATAPQSDAQSARDLVRDVIYNELHDRERDSHWEYRSACLSPAQDVVREQVETTSGPVFRLIEQDGKPSPPRSRDVRTSASTITFTIPDRSRCRANP